MKLGSAKGKNKKLRLDKHEADIKKYLKMGINKRTIAKLVGCAPSTLYTWLERRQVKNN